MARERMITRTVFSTEYEVLAVNLESKQVETVKINVPSADTLSPKQLTEAIKNNLPAGLVFVQITAETTHETLYGMNEADFIKYAVVLPNRPKKEV